MTRFTKMSAAALAAALLVPGMVAADGDDAQGTAAFESLAVTGGAGSILVTGTSTFGGETVQVATDDIGDGTLPGTDLAGLSITQDAGSDLLTFSMELADGLPTSGTLPVGAYYEWHLGVAGGESLALRANFTEYDTPGAEFVFSITTFSTDPTTGNGSFTSVPTDGSYDGTSLTWNVSAGSIGAAPGRKITIGAEGMPRVGAGIVGFVTFPGITYDDMQMGDFVVGGGARVVIKDAAGDTVESEVAKVRRGEFTANFDGIEAGAYTVEVYAEYGDAATMQSFPVTVA